MKSFGICRCENIETSIHYHHPLPTMPCYREWNASAEADFPVAKAITARIVSLPMFLELTPDERDHVIQNLLKG